MITLIIGTLMITPMLAMFAWEDSDTRECLREFGRRD